MDQNFTQKLFKNTSKFSDPGLIENDTVIFNDNLSEKITEKNFGKTNFLWLLDVVKNLLVNSLKKIIRDI
jgi:hypothetical protein